MIAVNLLPDVKQEFLRAKRIKVRVISIATLLTIMAVGLVVLLVLWVYVFQGLQKTYYTDQIKKNTTTMKAVPELDKYLTLQNQLNSLGALHANKNDFSRLFTYLPKLNPPAPNNVKLTNIELKDSDAGKTLVMKGETKDYTSLNIFRNTLSNAKLEYKGDDGKVVSEKLFESVVVNTSSLDKSTTGGSIVSFEVGLVYNPKDFLFSIKEPKAVVPDADTTASVVAAPDVFGKSTKQEIKP